MSQEEEGSDYDYAASEDDTTDDGSLVMEDDDPSQPSRPATTGTTTAAVVRNHSYLPGTSNPLFPASLVQEQQQRRRRIQRQQQQELEELAIMELEDIVLFPSQTLPLRLQFREWIEYLRPKIMASRDFNNDPTNQVKVGIVTHVSSPTTETRRRRSFDPLTRSFTTGTGTGGGSNILPLERLVQVVALGEEDDEEQEQDHEHIYEEGEEESEFESESDQEQQQYDDELVVAAEYHQLMDDDVRFHYDSESSQRSQRRREDDEDEADDATVSETHDTVPPSEEVEMNSNNGGPEEVIQDGTAAAAAAATGDDQHHRDVVVEEQKDDGDDDDEEENVKQDDDNQHEDEDDDDEDPRRDSAAITEVIPLRYDVDLVEENLDHIDESLTVAENVMADVRDEEVDGRHLVSISRRLDRIQAAQRPIVEAFDAILDLIRNGARFTDPDFGDMMTTARRHRVRVTDQLDRMQSIQFRLRRWNERTVRHANDDPLIGRIGTVAIVSYTFDEDTNMLNLGDNSALLRNEERSNELIVTVLGTNRFRIVSRVDSDDDNGALNQHRMRFRSRDISQVRMYIVEELPDKDPILPPLSARSQRPIPAFEDPSDANHHIVHYQEQMIQKLSNVSSIPQMAFNCTWPWRMVGLIRFALDRVSALDGLRRNLLSLEEKSPVLEPTLFSFWMASNMSLTQHEKLSLLKMPSTVERLRFILQKVLDQEKSEIHVCCQNCRSRIGNASAMFTVGGAEGTTGAYVNEYGVVHQTFTLRTAVESQLVYSGGPETRDSWFPGYAWTITYCQNCRSHLGWKFTLVGSSAGVTEDRPESFFGWSASSVTFSSQ